MTGTEGGGGERPAYGLLGRTGIKVSRLCFGALTISPLQANLPIREGADVLRRAFDLGINFVDTAEIYRTYPYLREALRGRPEVVLATKTYAYTAEGAEKSLRLAMDGVGRSWIDLFLLHEQEELTLDGHRPALEYFLRAKDRGLVRAVGFSTHSVAAVRKGAGMDEVDLIHPLMNREGLGLIDGTAAEMFAAAKAAHERGKGIYAMKALGGGHFYADAEGALGQIAALPFVDAVAVGLKTPEEAELDWLIVRGLPVPDELRRRVAARPRRLLIEEWCQGCGDCVERCAHGALSVRKGRAAVDDSRCLLCGYCASVCRDFCLKVV
ncbi:MAG: aldo/keto reductase [Bacillota bacterium]